MCLVAPGAHNPVVTKYCAAEKKNNLMDTKSRRPVTKIFCYFSSNLAYRAQNTEFDALLLTCHSCVMRKDINYYIIICVAF